MLPYGRDLARLAMLPYGRDPARLAMLPYGRDPARLAMLPYGRDPDRLAMLPYGRDPARLEMLPYGVALGSYPEWPHRQGGCLACCGCTFGSRAEVALIYTTHEALRGYCP